MKYIITITTHSTPDSIGWSDFITLEHNGELLFSGMCSTCPNPMQYSSSKKWRDAYGWISAGVFDLMTVEHHKYGKCCIVNNGGKVDARYPNVNNDNDSILRGVFIHEGNRNSQNPEWRGSAGCPTLPPAYWNKLVDVLPDGDGVLIINDGIK